MRGKKKKKKRQTHKYKAVQREHELISQKETGLIIKTILKDTEMHSGRPGKRREELRDGYNRSVRGSCCENEENKRQSEMRIKKKKKGKEKTQHACFRRCRNSSGAAINPDAKKTKKNRTRQHGKQAERRFSAGTTSLVSSSSILLECRPLACSQEEKCNSIFFVLPKATSQIPVSVRYTDAARKPSLHWMFDSPMTGKTALTSQLVCIVLTA